MSDLYDQAMQSHRKWDPFTNHEWLAVFTTCFEDDRRICLLSNKTASSSVAIIDCGEFTRSISVALSEDATICHLTTPVNDWYWYKPKGSGRPMIIETPTKIYSMGKDPDGVICSVCLYDEASTKNFHRVLANLCRIPVYKLSGLPIQKRQR